MTNTSTTTDQTEAGAQPFETGDIVVPREFEGDPTYNNPYTVQYAHPDGQLACTNLRADGTSHITNQLARDMRLRERPRQYVVSTSQEVASDVADALSYWLTASSDNFGAGDEGEPFDDVARRREARANVRQFADRLDAIASA